MRKMKKMNCLRFLMSKHDQSKRKLKQKLKRSSLRQGEKAKKTYHTTQQDDSAEVLKTINKRLQEKSKIFSEKVKKVKMRFLVTWLLQSRKALPVLFLTLSLNMR